MIVFADVRASGGVITEIDRRLPARPGDDEIDAGRRGASSPACTTTTSTCSLGRRSPAPPTTRPPRPSLPGGGGCRLAAYGATGVTDLTPAPPRRLDPSPCAAPTARSQHAVPARAPAAAEVPGLDDRSGQAGYRRLLATHSTLAWWMRGGRRPARRRALRHPGRPGPGPRHLDEAGPGRRPDRARLVVPPDLGAIVAQLAHGRHQPGFVLERGDRYLVGHPRTCPTWPAPRPDRGRHPGRRRHRRTVRPPDPWRAMRLGDRAAHRRRRAVRRARGRVPRAGALALFLTPPDDPRGRPRQVAVGRPRRPGGAGRPAVTGPRGPLVGPRGGDGHRRRGPTALVDGLGRRRDVHGRRRSAPPPGAGGQLETAGQQGPEHQRAERLAERAFERRRSRPRR